MQRMNYACLASTTAMTTLMSLSMAQAEPTVGRMTNLGTLGGNVSRAYAISADGSVIVGVADDTSGGQHAALWANGSTTATDLGTLGGTNSYAKAVSANDKFIVGGADMEEGYTHAVYWKVDGLTMHDLGTLGGLNSVANGVDKIGEVIFGTSNTTSGGNHAVLWNFGNPIFDLGTLGGSYSSAEAISGINNVIIGYAATSSGTNHAVSWDALGAITDLGTLDGGKDSYATAVNQDGSVIVGQAQTASGIHSHAVVWVDGATRPTDLGTLGGPRSYAYGVSADGTVIVGQAMTIFGDGDFHAASWVNGSTTATDLGTLGGKTSSADAVNADGSVIIGKAATDSGFLHAAAWAKGSTKATDLGTLGGDSSEAYAVSADGSLIVGSADTASGDSHGFIVKLGFAIQDNQNLIDSFFSLANDTAVAVAGQQAALGGLLGTGCVATAGSCFTVSGNLVGTGANGSIGSQGAGVSQITAGHAFSSTVTAGASLVLGRVNQTGSAFGDSTQTAASLWSNYSQNGSFSTGLMAHAAIGTSQGSETINRGVGFDNVVVSTGMADLTSSAVQASLSYGVQAKDGWLITPLAGFTWMETSRGAYSETTGVFPASFDELTTQSSYATLGLSAQRPIDARSDVSLGAGLDVDLSADHIGLSGTSDLPGMTSFTVTDSLSRNKLRPYFVAG